MSDDTTPGLAYGDDMAAGLGPTIALDAAVDENG